MLHVLPEPPLQTPLWSSRSVGDEGVDLLGIAGGSVALATAAAVAVIPVAVAL